ncbi:hypothetical protein HPB47_028325 [Ixodes persulcatus]|uniref:Uncharacterized protein n=1 Tax=Ixodes persulcatus TaxID=34615 RepID=A0AC60PTX4_IXOPE|nr:hypothetical protein HPB47_028325 [Ixodes persulcatus]
MDVSATYPEHALPALEFPSTSTHTVPGTGPATTALQALTGAPILWPQPMTREIRGSQRLVNADVRQLRGQLPQPLSPPTKEFGRPPPQSPVGNDAELSCPTHKILAARHMDREGRTVMITVDGSTLPNEVLYRLHLKKVFPFQVRAILCTRCHQLGHQHDVCPAAQDVCACGRPPHRHEIDGCHEPHQCVLCGGSHLATDGTCPKVKQATAQRRTRWAPPPQRKAQQQRRTLQAKPPPPPFAKDHGHLETIWPPLRPVTPTKPPHETTTLPRAQAWSRPPVSRSVQVMPRRIPPPRPPPPSSESIARARADTTRSQQRPQRPQGVQTTLAADDQPATRIELSLSQLVTLVTATIKKLDNLTTLIAISLLATHNDVVPVNRRQRRRR